ncbi:endonuclease/exonuclease/phosphatase [Firmicutes bacterium CAG:791]|nr:endonuclease/exonuclease/phosphatase [Firmicutes bacterium CAG:791]
MKRLCIALVSALLCISMIAPVHVMAAGNDVVYITDTGKKYHAANCSSLRKSKHAITLANAKASGYTPCSKCLGGTSVSASISTSGGTPAASANTVAVPAGITAEQAVQNAYALYVQNGLTSEAAMNRIQTVLTKLTAQPSEYLRIVQEDLALLNQSGTGSTASAEQLVQQMYAALVAQGMSSDQALAQVQANLPAIMAQAGR